MVSLKMKVGEILSIDNKDGYDGSYYLDKYCEYEKKYLNVLLTHSQLIIFDVNKDLSTLNLDANDVNNTTDILLQVILQYSYLKNEAHNALFDILNNNIDLNKINNIQGYTEFDMIEFFIENSELKIKYKPKNVDISFYVVDLSNINIKKT